MVEAREGPEGDGPIVRELRRRRGFTLLFGFLLVLFVLPVYIPRYLPFVDYPAHAAEVSVLLHLDDPAWQLQPYYERMFSEQYTVQQTVLTWIAHLTGPELSYRLFLTLYLVAVPLLTLAILLRLRRSPWPALLSFAVLYNYPLSFGFVHHCVGMAGVLLCAYWFERWSATERRRYLVALAAFSVVHFFLHPYGMLYWLGAGALLAGLRAFHRGGGWRHVGTLVATSIPGVGLAVLFTRHHPAALRTLEETFPSLHDRFQQLSLWAGGIWKDSSFYLVVLIFGALALVALLLPRDGSAPDDTGGWRETLWRRRYLVLAAALGIATFVAPEYFIGQSYIASRFPAAALIVLPLGVSDARAWGHRVWRTLAATNVAALGLVILSQMASFGLETRSFEAVIREIPQAARVRAQIDDPQSPLFVLPVYRHFGSWVLAERGGLNGFIFRKLGLEYREAVRVPVGRLYYWGLKPTERFDYLAFGDLYDYWLVRSSAETLPYDDGPIAPFFTKLAESGRWRLYRRVRSFAEAGAAAGATDPQWPMPAPTN